ncbi:MAG: hypothetical protein H8F28_12805 [Fibrella sp.]|nr:hypothetical protein [Armatimonadota bacterium]
MNSAPFGFIIAAYSTVASPMSMCCPPRFGGRVRARFERGRAALVIWNGVMGTDPYLCR